MLGPAEFGRQLIKTGDLDPVYIAINGAKLPHKQLAKLLFAYWCFYHLGLAAWLSEQKHYWRSMRTAAENVTETPYGGPWPRGTERRHFRGYLAVRAVDILSRKSPEAYVEALLKMRTVAEIMGATSQWPLFGPWIGYKIADMVDRCLGSPVEFTPDVCLLYKEPRAALDLIPGAVSAEQKLVDLLGELDDQKAPPTGDRALGFAEVETVLCKWKSYRSKHYFIGKDIYEVRHHLAHWGAGTMLKAMPAVPFIFRGRMP